MSGSLLGVFFYFVVERVSFKSPAKRKKVLQKEKKQAISPDQLAISPAKRKKTRKHFAPKLRVTTWWGEPVTICN